MPLITSRQNPRIKELVRLRQGGKGRDHLFFPVEGFREINRALAAGLALSEVYFCPQLLPSTATPETRMEALGLNSDTVFEVSPEVFQKLSTREHPDGLIGLFARPQRGLEALPTDPQALIILADGVEKPGNLGALIRSADAAGAAVLVTPEGCDFYRPQVIRNSQGAVFSTCCVSAPREAAERWLQQAGITVIGTSPDAPTLLWQADLSMPVALAVGSEAEGLDPFWLERATRLIRIPMAGQADSLNVSVSAALCLYEAVRQRRNFSIDSPNLPPQPPKYTHNP